MFQKIGVIYICKKDYKRGGGGGKNCKESYEFNRREMKTRAIIIETLKVSSIEKYVKRYGESPNNSTGERY